MKPTALAILLFLTLSIDAQTPGWLWAHGEGTGYINSQSIARDASGNVYVTGSITDPTIVFGTDTLINEATNGAENAFIVKYDSFGNVKWARSIGGGAGEGTERVVSAGIGVDAAGNAYVIGTYETAVVIFGKDTLVSIANGTSFLAKYNSQGTAMWAVNVGNDLDGANGIVVDANGNSYIVGDFTSGNIIGGTDTVTASGYVGAFMIKYDSSGNSLLAKGIFGDNIAINYAVAIDAATNIYVTGYIGGDSAVAGNITLHNTGSASVYTVKYESAGNVTWARNASVSQSIFPTAIGADGQGNVYIAGTTTADTLAFGNDTALTGVSTFDNYFIVRYDSSGNTKWVKSSRGYPYAYAQGISTDASGNTYLAGYFQNTPMIIGNDTLLDSISNLDGREALFIAKYDSSGNVVWGMGGLTTGNDADGGAGIVADNNGNFYLCGNYTGYTVAFGNDSLPYSGVPGDSNYIFVARYGTVNACQYSLKVNARYNDPFWAGGGTYDSICAVITQDSCTWTAVVTSGNSWLSTTSSGTGNGQISIALQSDTGLPVRTGTIDVGGQTLTINQDGRNLGITNIADPGISVYPNPSTGQFYFKGITSGNTLEVYDVLGQNIYSTIVNGNTYLLNISSQAKGVYFYRVVSKGNAIQDGKLVVE